MCVCILLLRNEKIRSKRARVKKAREFVKWTHISLTTLLWNFQLVKSREAKTHEIIHCKACEVNGNVCTHYNSLCYSFRNFHEEKSNLSAQKRFCRAKSNGIPWPDSSFGGKTMLSIFSIHCWLASSTWETFLVDADKNAWCCCDHVHS